MKKPKSWAVVDPADFPVGLVRVSIFKGTGVDIEELRQKPVIAVVNSHTEINPGHMHLAQLAQKVKEGIHAAGGIPFEFNVPAPCDGLTEGNPGMRYVLPQRELVADTIETHVRSMLFDGMVMIASCDKIIPGMLMAAARLDLPTVFLPGGPNAWHIRFMAGRGDSVDHKDYDDLGLKVGTATCSTCGSCEIMGTANTFQCLAEALGMTMPGSANIPAFHADKLRAARTAGKRVVEMVEEELTAGKIMTKDAVMNAVMVDLAIGGSTNSTLHLPAIAHEIGTELPLSVFNDLNTKIPTICGISPNGPHGMIDLYSAGGVLAVMKTIQDDLNLSAMNVTGRSFGDILAETGVLDEKVVRPRDKPFNPEGGTVVLFGNLAPEGSVVKQSGVIPEMRSFTGEANVMESEAEALKAVREGTIKEGQVVVIRNEGPKGGPGMPETLAVTMALDLSGMKKVALITDGRFSGATAGPCIGHVSPEAFDKGPIAAVKSGDKITVDIPGRKLTLEVPEGEIKKRLDDYKPPERDIPRGYMRRYVKLVSPASKGAVLF